MHQHAVGIIEKESKFSTSRHLFWESQHCFILWEDKRQECLLGEIPPEKATTVQPMGIQERLRDWVLTLRYPPWDHYSSQWEYKRGCVTECSPGDIPPEKATTTPANGNKREVAWLSAHLEISPLRKPPLLQPMGIKERLCDSPLGKPQLLQPMGI